MLNTKLVTLTAMGVGLIGVSALIHCSSDESKATDIPIECKVEQLNTETTEKTAKVFYDTANGLKTKAGDLRKRFTDLCDTINAELGDQKTSGEYNDSRLRAACNKVAARIKKAKDSAPDAGSATPLWAAITFDTNCQADTAAENTCIAQCADAPCDIAKACPADKQVGTCTGTCTGTCATKDSTCIGECRGACGTLPATTFPDGGINTPAGNACQQAECVGTCTAPNWNAKCEGPCRNFYGECGGTCTGKCDGQEINPQQPPPPPDTDGGCTEEDGGFDEDADAYNPPIVKCVTKDAAAPPVPIPYDKPGNCKGTCSGICSGSANGRCTGTPCDGGFSGGECFAGPVRCNGSCSQASIACTGTTCTGTCVSGTDGGATCAGECAGGCNGQMSNIKCTAPLACEANEQCKNACVVKGAIATTCAPPGSVDVRVIGDTKLYEALKKHLTEFAAIVMETQLVNDQSVAITNVTLGDYKVLNNNRDARLPVRLCVKTSNDVVNGARSLLATLVGAAQITKGTEF
jgi:hypothetical protein